MHRFLDELKDFTKKCDWVLLLLCLIVSGFGLCVWPALPMLINLTAICVTF